MSPVGQASFVNPTRIEKGGCSPPMVNTHTRGHPAMNKTNWGFIHLRWRPQNLQWRKEGANHVKPRVKGGGPTRSDSCYLPATWAVGGFRIFRHTQQPSHQPTKQPTTLPTKQFTSHSESPPPSQPTNQPLEFQKTNRTSPTPLPGPLALRTACCACAWPGNPCGACAMAGPGTQQLRGG